MTFESLTALFNCASTELFDATNAGTIMKSVVAFRICWLIGVSLMAPLGLVDARKLNTCENRRLAKRMDAKDLWD